MKKKLSVKVIMSLILSAVLFCMPIGAFMANSGNTVSVQAQDTDAEENESETETPSTGNEEESESEQESSLRCPAMTFPHRNVPVRKNAHSTRWIRNVRSAKRITVFVSM